MRPLVRSYGVISTKTLSPASTRIRFLRILPAVWAMISCPFSSFTRKVALGSNSLTVPGNSRSSSFAIRPLLRGLNRAGDCTERRELQAKAPALKALSQSCLTLQMQHTDEREQASRGIVIHLNLAFEALHEELRTFIVGGTATHIECFNL